MRIIEKNPKCLRQPPLDNLLEASNNESAQINAKKEKQINIPEIGSQQK